ncbi:host cell division inhibitor Icd-like protein [Salmonella enterica]|nr:hypothetical protein CGA23_21415 [Salmonella enterica subsp. enterica]EAA2700426.1 host cell division inhibitor Icd-like protein [Salmonella enterica]EHF3504525.1 host cell division inhibitor Icd-like protein [Salmonella enterica subsp. enterica serovar 6,8,20:d-]HBJ6610383.1 host cell division inhibitor Icd-like protein [Salmonella enterica subsp. enterica serovar 6,8:d:-]HBJ6961898.1 host cell division inhibitor Icd-like protein [Salmonella enterica subsp. enterica serovar Duisburg]
MSAQFLPAKSSVLTQVENSLRVVQDYPEIIGAVNYENFVEPCPFSSVVARLRKSDSEAANMAISTRPQGRTSSHLKSVNKLNKPLFVWRFFSCQQSTYHTVTAASEREARLQLPAVRLVFAARIRLEGVRHA